MAKCLLKKWKRTNFHFNTLNFLGRNQKKHPVSDTLTDIYRATLHNQVFLQFTLVLIQFPFSSLMLFRWMSGQQVPTEKLKSWFIRFHRIMKSLREEISDCEILLNFLLLDYFLQFLTQLFHLTAPGDLKRSKIIRKLQDFWEKHAGHEDFLWLWSR